MGTTSEARKRREEHGEPKRYRVVRSCICTASERGNGWGCCCARPETVVADPEGDMILVPYTRAI